MESEIFEQFPDRESFDAYWNEHYVPVTYEDVKEVFVQFKAYGQCIHFLSIPNTQLVA